MIFAYGNFKPTADQRREAWDKGDCEFTTTCGSDFEANLPVALNVQPAQTPILLKMRHVEPHSDSWVGCWSEEPVNCRRRAMFWIVRGSAIIHVGDSYRRMYEGDWVLFNDAIVHSVYSTKLWAGAAWQLKTKSRRIKQLSQGQPSQDELQDKPYWDED